MGDRTRDIHRGMIVVVLLICTVLKVSTSQAQASRTAGFALWFDGIDDFVGIQHPIEAHWPRVDGQDWTIEFWLKDDSQPYYALGNAPDAVSLATPASAYVFRAGMWGALIAGGYCVRPSTASPTDAQHFAYTVSRTESGRCSMHGFINGTEFCSRNCYLSAPGFALPRQPLILGPAQQKDGRHNFPLMWMDDFRFWNGARKARAIQATHLMADTALQNWLDDPKNAELLSSASDEPVATFPSLEMQLNFDVPYEKGVYPGFDIPGSAPLAVASPFIDIVGSPEPLIAVRGMAKLLPFLPSAPGVTSLGVVISLGTTALTADQVGLVRTSSASPPSSSRLAADDTDPLELSWCLLGDATSLSGRIAFVSDVAFDRLLMTITSHTDTACSPSAAVESAVERLSVQVLEPPPANSGIGLDIVTLGTGYISIPHMPHSPEWTLEFWFQWSFNLRGSYCMLSWLEWPGQSGMHLCNHGASGGATLTWPDGSSVKFGGLGIGLTPFRLSMTSSREDTNADICDPATTYVYKIYSNGVEVVSQGNVTIDEKTRQLWGWPNCRGDAAAVTHLPLTLAVRWLSGPTQTYGTNSRFSDIRVWSKARSQEEIIGDYTSRLTGNEANLYIYYPVTPEDQGSERVAKRLRNYATTGSRLDAHLGCLSLAHLCSPSQGYGTAILPSRMTPLQPMATTVRVSHGSITPLDLQPDFSGTERLRASETLATITTYPSSACGSIGLRPISDTTSSIAVNKYQAGVNDAMFQSIDLTTHEIIFEAVTQPLGECETVLGWRLLNLRGEPSLHEATIRIILEIAPPGIEAVEELRGVRYVDDNSERSLGYNILVIRFSFPTNKPKVGTVLEWSRFLELAGVDWGLSSGEIAATPQTRGIWSEDGMRLSLVVLTPPGNASSDVIPDRLFGSVHDVIVRGGVINLSDSEVLSQLHRNLTVTAFVNRPPWVDSTELLWDAPDWLPAPPLGWDPAYPSPAEDPLSNHTLQESSLRGVLSDGKRSRWVDSSFALPNGVPYTSTPCPPGEIFYPDIGSCKSCGPLQRALDTDGYCVCAPGYEPKEDLVPGLQNLIDRFVSSEYLACRACPPGTESRDNRCIDCLEGSFNDVEAQTTCKRCPAGTYRASSDPPTSCKLCFEGSDSDEGASSCRPCRPGTYHSSFNNSNVTALCQLCPVGTYATASGSQSCEACPRGMTTSHSGADDESDCLCERGKFWNRETLECEECQSGMICDFGSRWPVVAEGYWTPSLSLEELRSYKGSEVFRCLRDTQCPSRALDAPQCEGGNGAEGFLCLDCPSGWYQSSPGRCAQCANTELFGAVITLFIICLVPMLIAFYVIQSGMHGTSHASILGLMIKFYSTLAVLSSFNVVWLDPLSQMLSSGKLVALDTSALRPSCMAIFDDPRTSYAIRITAPLIIMGMYGILWGASYLVLPCRKREATINPADRAKSRMRKFYESLFRGSVARGGSSRVCGEVGDDQSVPSNTNGQGREASARHEAPLAGAKRPPHTNESTERKDQSEWPTMPPSLTPTAAHGEKASGNTCLTLPIPRRHGVVASSREMSVYTDRSRSSSFFPRWTPLTLLRDSCPWEANLVVNAYLSLFHILFIASCQASFLVFECYAHPNGKYSVVSFPSVFCYGSQWWSHYFPLALFGLVVFVFGFTCLLSAVVFLAPRYAPHYRWFGECFYFAFNPFRPSAWFFCVPFLIRNTMMTMLPVLAPGDGELQALLLCIVLVAALVGQFVLWPWAALINNVMDVTLLIGLLFISLASMHFAVKSSNASHVFTGVAVTAFITVNTIFVVCCLIILLRRLRTAKEGRRNLLSLTKQIKHESTIIASHSLKDLAHVLERLSESDMVQLTGVFKLLQKQKIAASRTRVYTEAGNDTPQARSVGEAETFDEGSFDDAGGLTKEDNPGMRYVMQDDTIQRSTTSLLAAQTLHQKLFAPTDSDVDSCSSGGLSDDHAQPPSDPRERHSNDSSPAGDAPGSGNDTHLGSCKSELDSIIAREVIRAAKIGKEAIL